MTLLSELQEVMEVVGLPCEIGVFSDKAPDNYSVITPLYNRLDLHADNLPTAEVQEARISIFTKDSFTALRYRVTYELLRRDMSITGSLYVGLEADTGYHHYAVDVAKQYKFELED